VANFVQSFQQQSWYPQVEAVMQQYGVPDYLWEGVVEAESGGNPKAYNPNDPDGGSYGLFQINGVHGNAATWPISQQATWAAQQLAPVARSLPSNATPAQATIAAENAAWPGSANSSTGRSEYAGRLSAMQAAQAGNSQGGAQFTGATTTSATSTSHPALNPLGSFGASLDNWVRGGSFSNTEPTQQNWVASVESYLTNAGWWVLGFFIAAIIIIVGVLFARS